MEEEEEEEVEVVSEGVGRTDEHFSRELSRGHCCISPLTIKHKYLVITTYFYITPMILVNPFTQHI